jgi:hypothetical protein
MEVWGLDPVMFNPRRKSKKSSKKIPGKGRRNSETERPGGFPARGHLVTG